MSKSSDQDFDLELHFLPAWAQKPAQETRYADYGGPSEGRDTGERRERRRDRGPGGPRPQRRDDRPRGRDGQRPPGSAEARGPRPPRGDRRDRGQGPRREEHRPAPPPAPLPEVQAAFVPDDKGVDSLARQIKMTGRAYPLFEIAQMILQKPERYSVTLTAKKKPDGTIAQPLFVCALDDTVWLSEDEAVRWILEKHFDTFYQADKTKIDPPKGTYTFVAQCGMSGTVLGPPNYHDYQVRLRKLHAERFSRMPFDVFKSRVKIVKDEETVKKWVEEQSWKTEYVCLNLPEPLRLGSREEVEKHFRETHLPNIVKQVETTRLTGTASRGVRSQDLARLARLGWEDQRRFPLQIATVLSQQFAARGLQFFKVGKTITHVAVARPHFLDMEATPVSEGVRKIVEYINARSKINRRDLLAALAPAPTPAEASATPAEQLEPTPEQTAVIADLHWLIHQGHVIEFANGTLETAKKPVPKPPKPEKTPAAAAPQAEPIEATNVSVETSEPGTVGPDVGLPVSTPTEPGTAEHSAHVEAPEIEPQPASASP
ncbi:MAG TPA: hypothetical protein VFB63_28155, partial [Bryobacteraceae bacterium]|nr:hypothetical protein [Bryobacteraceae bacterium]